MFSKKRYRLDSDWTGDSKFLIYAIIDPETQSIVYVGRSSSGSRRPKSHFYDSSFKRRSPLISWIKHKIALGHIPIITILETTNSPNKLNTLERYYIQESLQEEGNLKNLTLGGEGVLGYRRSEESKKKMSERYKGQKPSELCYLMNKLSKTGNKLSKEHKLTLRKKSYKAKKIICLTNNKIYFSSRHAKEDFKEIKCHKSIINAAKTGRLIKNISFRLYD